MRKPKSYIGHVIQEIVSTEAAYVHDLSDIMEVCYQNVMKYYYVCMYICMYVCMLEFHGACTYMRVHVGIQGSNADQSRSYFAF